MLFSMLKQSAGSMKGGGRNSHFLTLVIYFLIALLINALLVNLTYNQVAGKILSGAQPLDYWDSMMLVILAMVLFH